MEKRKLTDISELLIFAVEQNASDLHISAGEPPRVRINGDIRPIDMPPLSPNEVHMMIYGILTDYQKKRFEEEKELDLSISLGNYGRFRANIFYQQRGEAISLRTIPDRIRSIDELGLPKILRKIAKYDRGLVLVTGPTGSGKSTTLAALIDLINTERKAHIITIEDPIEFIHESKECLVNQRELGAHTKSFANALRSALREDPDVILLGEMRDLETIALALTAAETGHLVFSTVHTNNAPKTIDRIIDAFPATQQAQIRTQLSATLQAVISQTLVKRRDRRGRVPVVEIMIGTPAIRNLIREGKISQIPSMMEAGQKFGMQTMAMSLKKLISKGIVKPKDVEGLLLELEM